MKKYHILVVDDEKINHVLIDAMLHDENYDITHTYDGKDAVELVKKNNYDIILMDIKMSVMNGIEATKYSNVLKKTINDFLN